MAQPGQLQVGQLYLGFYRNGLKVWSQPGGIGTPVVPPVPSSMPWFGEANNSPGGNLYQWPMAYPAQYYFGCGHPLNCVEVYSYFDPYAPGIMALICCPMCSYIQEIMPYTEYQSYVDTPLVVA